MRRFVVSIALLALLLPAVPGAASEGEAQSYIVVMRDDVREPGSVAAEHARSENAQISHVYGHALKGYAATMAPAAAARLSNDPRVLYVELDGLVEKTDVQSNATWGLDRIDQASLPLNSSYTYEATGAGVTAFVVDSGVDMTKASKFVGGLESGIDEVDGGTADDCDGHGTHVAGTIGSSEYGVAKNVRIVAVRVLDCNGSGYWSDVIAGVDWVTAHRTLRSVANMSLGGGFSSSVNQAVANSIAAGVTYAVAAGNGNKAGVGQDACNYSPASTTSALTVGATSDTDTKAGFSNYGTCVDLFAPGVNITSTVMDKDAADPSWNGTSMAAPHVAGVAALKLESATDTSPSAIGAAITGTATAGVVANAGSGSPNLLLHSLGSQNSGGTAPTTPTATKVSVTQIAYSTAGRKGADLVVSVTVKNDLGQPVSGATVGVTISRDGGSSGTASGTTSTTGVVTVKWRNAPAGTYRTTVNSVTGTAWPWDGATPSNSYVKS